MNTWLRYILVFLLAFQTIFAFHGCAPISSHLQPPPSEEVRETLGNIAVVPASFTPAFSNKGMAKDKGAGAGRGATLGGLYLLRFIAETEGFGFVLLWFMLFPESSVGEAFGKMVLASTGIGAAVGADSAESGEAVEAGEREIREALKGIQKKMAGHIMAAAVERTEKRYRLLADGGPANPNEMPDYKAFQEEGVDTVLEVAVMEAGLWNYKLAINPPLAFQMKLRARLIRTADGETLYEQTFLHSSGFKRFREWVADAAAPVDREAKNVYRDMAELVVEELFLVYRPLKWRPKKSRHTDIEEDWDPDWD